MSQLVIEIDNPEDEALLLRLLPKLNGRVIKKLIPASKSNESPVAILKRIAERGSNSFGNPSEWQREIRGWDRIIDGREE